jgi:hypothetical protein
MQLTTLFIGVAINLVVIALVYIHLDRRLKKRESSQRIISDVRREVDEMLVELNQTADRNVGILEERIGRISRIIEEADKRIRLLQKTTDTFTMSTATYSNVRPRVKRSVSNSETEGGDAQNESSKRSGARESPGELDFGSSPEEQPASPQMSRESAVRSELEARQTGEGGEPQEEYADAAGKREQVRTLYRQGMSSDVIASRLDTTVGEVELMITLMEERER